MARLRRENKQLSATLAELRAENARLQAGGGAASEDVKKFRAEEQRLRSANAYLEKRLRQAEAGLQSVFPITVSGTFSPIRSVTELKPGRVIQKTDGNPHVIHYRKRNVLTVDALMTGDVFPLDTNEAKRLWKIHPTKLNKEMQSFRRHRLGIAPLQAADIGKPPRGKRRVRPREA